MSKGSSATAAVDSHRTDNVKPAELDEGLLPQRRFCRLLETPKATGPLQLDLYWRIFQDTRSHAQDHGRQFQLGQPRQHLSAAARGQ